MIQKETYLQVADNSGARLLQCIHVIGSTGKRFASVGQEVICTVKSAVPGGTVKKSDIVRVVIARTKVPQRRADGSYIRFGDNAGIIVVKDKKSMEPVATRIFGPVARELRAKGYTRIVSLAPEVL